MHHYVQQLAESALTQEQIAELPERFQHRDEAGTGALQVSYEPADVYLLSCGFTRLHATDPLQLNPLPELAQVEWKRYMLVSGEFHTGKTTLAANWAYWSNYSRLDRAYPRDVQRFDVGELARALCHPFGLARGCDELCGGERDGEALQTRIECALDTRFASLVILDDFNFTAFANERQAQAIADLVMARFNQCAPVWLLSNEDLPALAARFPRLLSRIAEDDRWQVVEKTKPGHIQTASDDDDWGD